MSGTVMDSDATVDFTGIPPIFVLAAHIDVDDRHDLEDKLMEADAPLTYNIDEARIFVGNINTKRRAELELRMLRLWTTDATNSGRDTDEANEMAEQNDGGGNFQPRKRRKVSPNFTVEQMNSAIVIDDLDGSSTESEPESENRGESTQPLSAHATPEVDALVEIEPLWSLPRIGDKPEDVVFVLKVAWLVEVFEQRKMLPIEGYLVYAGLPRPRPPSSSEQKVAAILPTAQSISIHQTPSSRAATAGRPTHHHAIVQRAQTDAPRRNIGAFPSNRRRFGGQQQQHHHHRKPPFASSKEKASLLQQATTDYESTGDSETHTPPEWVQRNIKYACMRRTPADQPNAVFIEVLKKIRTTRELSGDDIGVRAYSTSIAALAAYPYLVQHPKEILHLPGCDIKIANLWVEWKNNDGQVEEADDAEKDETMRILKDFYGIWGVGATTARDFFYGRGWHDRDDVVEYGWDMLTRVQQIGLKYYDEFLDGIPRSEVARIASVVKSHAIRVRDAGIEILVVGGYRRGKVMSGDVDIIVSHRQLEKTANLVTDIVASLETEEWITHTLLLTIKGTQRGQATLPYRGGLGGGHGFDTLDKALVVWQDPLWPDRSKFLSKASESRSGSSPAAPSEQERRTSSADLKALRKANPNPHRRVDIIVSPWRTVGCAVLGWSGGTTFQRDVRRYAKNVKGWKFDSSGIRDRRTGMGLEIEGPDGVLGDGMGMIEAEKKVFEGLGLAWIPPEDRWTH